MDHKLITVVNQLQDALAPLGGGAANPIDLPQITVVGSQSSGKSSVLENIVGRDFLPRGTGIVTRRPLVLQLIHRRAETPTNSDGSSAPDFAPDSKPDAETNPNEWGEFLHIPGHKFYNFNDIRDEIIRETESTAGTNAGISPVPINLRIYSPNVLTLTLVDLPGLTKVAVGDQPKDIEKLIRDMVLRFISKPNAIILSVTAANTDLANSDGLKLAREVDPEGTRTVGVLTKIDLMDPGTDVVDILAGRVIPLRYGYVPVVNRGQKDINGRMTIKAALEAEKRFFESHPAYSSKAEYCGTPFLAKKLSTILLSHIRATLPDIKRKIEATLKRYESELIALGPEALGTPSSVVLGLITEFVKEYRAVLDGETAELTGNELSGGARIAYVFHEIFRNGIGALDPFDEIGDSDIRTILYNSSGSAPALFVGTRAFELLAKKQIHRFEDPARRCVALVFEELVRILQQILSRNPVYTRYPAIKEQLSGIFVQYLRKLLIPTNQLVTDLVRAEAGYINTAHPDLLKGSQAMAMVQERLPHSGAESGRNGKGDGYGSGFFGTFFNSAAAKNRRRAAMLESPPAVLKATGAMTEREMLETEVIKLLLASYFNIVKRTITDLIPKGVMMKLILKSKDEVQQELLEQIYSRGDLEELVKENDFTIQRRKECLKMVEVLKNASEIVSRV